MVYFSFQKAAALGLNLIVHCSLLLFLFPILTVQLDLQDWFPKNIKMYFNLFKIIYKSQNLRDWGDGGVFFN